MAVTTFLACNALTNGVIAELPMINPSYTRTLCDSGTLTGDLALDAAGVVDLLANGGVEPGAVSIYVQRDGTYVWGGILWNHAFDASSSRLTLNAAEFGTILSQKSIFSTTATYSGEVAAQCAAWVVAAFASAGVPVSTLVTPTATNLSLTVNPWETHCYLDLIKSYAVAIGGIDWAFDVTQGPQAQFTASYPRRGQSYVNSAIVWDFPGSLLNLTLNVDAQRIAANLIESGAGTASSLVQAVVSQSSSGHVALDVVDSNNSLTSQPDVQSYASGKLFSMRTPPLLAKCQLPASVFYASGATVGDEIQVATPPDNPYLRGINLPARIIAYTVKMATTSSVELVDVSLGPVL
jgi:hypothetical protein